VASDQDVRQVAAFVRGLQPPRDAEDRLKSEVAYGTTAQSVLDRFIRGKEIFEDVGCNDCHVTEPYFLDDGRQIVPMSDFLCHDMGPFLDDGVQVKGGCTSSSQWRTPALWDTGSTSVWMHDGSGARLGQLIALHGGEAAAARAAVENLPGPEPRLLRMFLQYLRY
jgi:CxxC motif-containing protein (DUF1111 family)